MTQTVIVQENTGLCQRDAGDAMAAALPNVRARPRIEAVFRFFGHQIRSHRVLERTRGTAPWPGKGAAINYALTGPDPATLDRLANELTVALRSVPGAVDVDNSLIVGKPEARVSIDRDRAADLGVQISDIASTLQIFVGGAKASTFPEKSEQYDIRVRGEERFRADPAELTMLTVPSSKHGSVPLASVVKIEPTTGPTAIKRVCSC